MSAVSFVCLAAALAAPPAERADEASVKAADASMSAASQRRDADAFLAHLADDALFLAGGEVAEGKAAVRQSWASFLTPGGPTLTWSPERAVVAASSDLAFTTGRYAITNCERPKEGGYVTVWRKVGGAWRASLDGPNLPASALGPGLQRTALRTLRSQAGDLEASAGRWERPRPEGGHDRGTFLLVRRRSQGPDWQPVIDVAVAERP
jgi:ketosteroid isomerase-like protein